MSKEVFESIKAGLEEALAHARGEITLPSRQVHVPQPESPKRLTKEKSTKRKKK